MKHVEIARAEMGTHEVAGAASNPRIMEYFRACGSSADWVKDDSTPWCGAFMGWLARQQGLGLPPEPLRARSWATWGDPLDKFEPGCVVVTTRGKDPAAGHVTLGVEAKGDTLMCLGGNQGDEVSIVGVSKASVIAYRRFPGVSPVTPLQVAVKSQTIRNAAVLGGAITGKATDEATGVFKETVDGIKGIFGADTSIAWFLEQARGELKWLFVFVGITALAGVIAQRLKKGA
jgi:uncharacterized protein (TIGR02594 family)